MHATKAETLDILISQLDAQIMATEHLGIAGTRLLLSMARLDLQAQRHDIDDRELRTLCSTVERALTRTDRSRRRNAGPAKRSRPMRPRLGRVNQPAGHLRHP
jgi:hypothetical protein